MSQFNKEQMMVSNKNVSVAVQLKEAEAENDEQKYEALLGCDEVEDDHPC